MSWKKFSRGFKKVGRTIKHNTYDQGKKYVYDKGIKAGYKKVVKPVFNFGGDIIHSGKQVITGFGDSAEGVGKFLNSGSNVIPLTIGAVVLIMLLK